MPSSPLIVFLLLRKQPLFSTGRAGLQRRARSFLRASVTTAASSSHLVLPFCQLGPKTRPQKPTRVTAAPRSCVTDCLHTCLEQPRSCSQVVPTSAWLAGWLVVSRQWFLRNVGSVITRARLCSHLAAFGRIKSPRICGLGLAR